MTPEFWLNLQRMYDLDLARALIDISAIEPLFEASIPIDRPWAEEDTSDTALQLIRDESDDQEKYQ